MTSTRRDETESGDSTPTMRPLGPEEVRRLFIRPEPGQDYRFYVLDPLPASAGQNAEGQWVERLHAEGLSVLGVWEERRDPLLLHLRPMWIDRERVEWWTQAATRHHGDPGWAMPFNPFEEAPGGFWGTPTELWALVRLLASWAGEPPVSAAARRPHFVLKRLNLPEEPPDLEDRLEGIDPEMWLAEVPVGEPPDDLPPWDPGDLEEGSSVEDSGPPPGEVPDWEPPEEPAEPGEEPEEFRRWAWDPEDLYFGEPAYHYVPDPEVPTAGAVYTMVGMPTWRRTSDYDPWMYWRLDPGLGAVEVGSFWVVSYQLDDLRDPEFDPYIAPSLGRIDLNQAALHALCTLLEGAIGEYERDAARQELGASEGRD